MLENFNPLINLFLFVPEPHVLVPQLLIICVTSIYFFFPITCATDFVGFFLCFFFAKKSLFRHFSGFKKHYVAFSKKLILALGEQYKSVYRYVLCLNIIKFINEPPF